MNVALRATPIEQAFTSALYAMQCAQRVVEGFLRYNDAFRRITLRAPERFAARDWSGSQADAVERIELYGEHIGEITGEIARDFAALARCASPWRDRYLRVFPFESASNKSHRERHRAERRRRSCRHLCPCR